MDGYTTLLNFYLMSSINTGSTLLDILLAMFIPLVCNEILRVLRGYVLIPIQRAVQCCLYGTTKTSLIVSHDTAHGASLDLNENPVLQEALMHYVGNVVRPTYPFGSYRFTRLAATNETARNASLAETLRHTYFLHTIPSSEKAVELAPGLTLRIFEDERKNGKNGEQTHTNSLQGGEPAGASNSREKDLKKEKKTTLLFETKTNAFTREDVMMSFTQRAFQIYKNGIKRTVNSERYLFQPLLQEKETHGENLDMVVGPTRCQRYPLSREKTFNTLFFPEKERLIHLIHQFETRSGKFAVPGFPHKLILLLYGPPGTGKTSLVKAIAAHTNRHILSIPLSHIKTNHELLNLMHDARFCVVNRKNQTPMNRNGVVESVNPEKVVYMLEDIDAASEVVRNPEKANSVRTERQRKGVSKAPNPPTIDRDAKTETQIRNHNALVEGSEETTGDKHKAKPKIEKVVIPGENTYERLLAGVVEDPLSLKGLLEAFGGILDAPGRIVILTTNHVDCLTPALLKPGIITMKLYMGNFNVECGIEMIKHYFRAELDGDCNGDVNNNNKTTTENSSIEEGHKSCHEILHEIGNVISAEKRNGAGFSPAEVEQMCAENNTLKDLLVALKRGSCIESF